MHQIWTRSLKPEWRGSGLLTRRPVDGNHSRPPWTSYRSGRTGRTLNPLAMPIAGSNPAWSSMCLYPNGRGNALRARSVLVRVEPGTPDFVGLGDSARSCGTRSICAVMHRVRQLDCLSSETGSSPVQRAISGVWRSLEALFVRNEEVAGSNPATPTNTASALACGSVL